MGRGHLAVAVSYAPAFGRSVAFAVFLPTSAVDDALDSYALLLPLLALVASAALAFTHIALHQATTRRAGTSRAV